jgi:hypothetical protein
MIGAGAGQGFGMGENGAGRKKFGAVVRAGAFIGRRRGPRHDVERGEIASSEEKGSTPSCCPACVLERMRMNVSSLFWTKRYGPVLGCGFELGIGLLDGLQRGLSGQLRQGRFFSHFLFCFYFFFCKFSILIHI